MSKNDESKAMELAPIAEARMIFEAKPQRTRSRQRSADLLRASREPDG